MERIEEQLNFIREIDKEKEIFRQTYLADGSRKENDAEHAWHMAIMTMLLSEYANEKIDVLKTVGMLLIHDIVEIDAGDTYAYDKNANATKRERELKAADRIFNILPEDQAKKLRGLWDEFEEYQTPEAKFAHVMDNLAPVMLSDAVGGKGWKEHGVFENQVYGRNKRTPEGSETLYQVIDEVFRKNIQLGNIKGDNK